MPDTTQLINVHIKRDDWLRGEGSEASALLRSTDGKMCCLGFACLALGKSKEEISDAASPAVFGSWWRDEEYNQHLHDIEEGVDTYLRRDNPTSVLMRTNDDAHMLDREREHILTKEARNIGLNFIFED